MPLFTFAREADRLGRSLTASEVMVVGFVLRPYPVHSGHRSKSL